MRGRRTFCSKVYSGRRFTQRFSQASRTCRSSRTKRYPAMKRNGYQEPIHPTLLIGAGPQVLPLHDSSVDRIQSGRSWSLDHALIATQMKFYDFQQAAGSDRRTYHQFEYPALAKIIVMLVEINHRPMLLYDLFSGHLVDALAPVMNDLGRGRVVDLATVTLQHQVITQIALERGQPLIEQ